MSYGALNLGDEYLSLSSEVVRPGDFENTKYIMESPLLTEGFGIPESAIPQLNKIIGQFLMTIQKASFIHRSILEVVPLARHEWEEQVYSHEPLVRSSTLSANTIVVTVRQNIEKTVRDVITLTQGSDPKNAVDDTGAGQTPKEKPPVRNEAVLFSDAGHQGELDYADLLTDEARNLIDQFGTGCAEAVNELLRGFAESILARSDLSFSSLTRDVTRLAMQPKESSTEANLPKDAPYSTLNPIDLIEMAQRNLQYYPAGLSIRLPEETKKRIFARMLEATQNASSAPTATENGERSIGL